jgi:hypothetical protein
MKLNPRHVTVNRVATRQSRKDRGKRLLRGLTGRPGHAEFLEPRFDGATRLPDCLRDVIVCHVLELRQDSVTSLEQFLQKVGLFHDANLAAVRLLKTASFRQSLLGDFDEITLESHGWRRRLVVQFLDQPGLVLEDDPAPSTSGSANECAPTPLSVSSERIRTA